MKILLVNPDSPVTFWGLKHMLKFISRKSLLPPLGLLTVAAILPSDWEKRLIDLSADTLEDQDLQWADYVFLTGMYIQKKYVEEIIDRCKQVGVKIVAGGPLFTEFCDDYGHVDHLVLGEAEVTLPGFLKDLEAGCPKHLYLPDRWADMQERPMPLWELIDRKSYGMMPIQYSRGCPYDCDFCDATGLFGRKIRAKAAPQIVAELERVYVLGWRGLVFFVDDNFIGNKRTVKREVLPAIIDWMQRRRYPFSIYAQVSIDLADDDELLRLMGQAGIECVFIGIETPSREGLTECHKIQNLNRDLVADIHKIQGYGLEVQGGFIVGFDSDTPDIFDELIEFIQESGIVTAIVGLLNAPPATRLYERLAAENRLLGCSSGDSNTINFIPKMGRDTLIAGHRRVLQTICSHENHYLRIRKFLEYYRPLHKVTGIMDWSDLKGLGGMTWRLGILGRGRRYYWKLWLWALRHPLDIRLVFAFTSCGFHFRQVLSHLDVTESHPAEHQDEHGQYTIREYGVVHERAVLSRRRVEHLDASPQT